MLKKVVRSKPISADAPESSGPLEDAASALSQTKPLSQFEELRTDVLRAYEQGVSMEEAERLAAKFLSAQMDVAEKIRTTDLDARMKKNGYKTLRAKVYIDTVQASDKKPTEASLDATIATDPDVAKAQDAYERADVDSETLQRYFDIFRDCHIFYRSVLKGNS